HPDAISYEVLGLLLLILGVPLLPLLGFWTRYPLLLFSVVYGLYLAAILSMTAYLALRYRLSHLIYLPPIFLTIHFGVAAGFLSRAVKCLFSPKLERDAAVDARG